MRSLLLCIVVASGLWVGAQVVDESADDHGLPHAVAYDFDTFHAEIPHQPHFIMFYAPWFVSVFTCVSYAEARNR